MSGIAGVYDISGVHDDVGTLIQGMCQALRRSDREAKVEWYTRPGFAIGRCKPVLINQTSQPAWNEDRTICAFFHGEIFGYEELKRSLERKGHRFADNGHAEFVVHLYEEQGDAFIHALNGGFALALWDSRQHRLIIANDRYSLCPIYAAQSGGKYLWASAPRAILARNTFSRQLNLAAMADLLCVRMPQCNDTIFEGIEELPPASMVICQAGQVCHHRYWDLAFQQEETGISADDYLDELSFLVKQSADRRQTDELGKGLLLSGGLDSRLLLSTLGPDSVTAFTFGTPFCDDIRFARRVAKVANVPHVILEVRPDFLETFAWTAIGRIEDLVSCDYFTGICVYDEIAPQVDVLFMAHVCEDLLGHVERDPGSEFWADGFSVDRYYDSKSIMTDGELERLVRPAYFREMRGLARSRFHRDFGRCPSRHITHKADYWGIMQQQRRLYNRLAGSLLPDDLQYRPVFFDNDLVDFAQTIPPSLRWGEGSLYKQAMLRLAPKMAEIPFTTTYGLPLNVTHAQVARHRRQRRRWRRWRHRLSRVSNGVIPPMSGTDSYVDYDGWLKRELRGWAESILLDSQTLNRPYWNTLAIPRLMEAHVRESYGTERQASQLAALISFELWHRMYPDTDSVLIV